MEATFQLERSRLKQEVFQPIPEYKRVHAVTDHSVFAEADEDGNGNLDLYECRHFLKKCMHRTFLEQEWDEEQLKNNFYCMVHKSSRKRKESYQ